MARYFNNAADKILLGSAPVTAAPFTLACWAKLDTLQPTDALYHHFFGVQQVSGGGSDDGHYIGVDNRVGANRGKLFAQSVAAGAFNVAAYGDQAPSGWFHHCGVFASTTSRSVYLNGGTPTTNTSSSSPTGINDMTMGLYHTASGGAGGGNVGTQIAECAIWNVALDAAEIAALAKGYSPALIRPASLVFYAPLIREAISRKGGTLAVTGTTVANHPRIIHPRRRAA